MPARVAKKAGDSAEGYYERTLPDGGKMEMVYCPAPERGWFWMGDDDEQEIAKHNPRRRQALTTGFYVGRFPVTVEQFGRFVAATGRVTTAETDRDEWDWRQPGYAVFEMSAQKSDEPVVCVSALDSDEFCEWAGLRLTDDHEWEYAARGSKDPPPKFPWGDDSPGVGLLWWEPTRDDHVGTCSVGRHPRGASWCGAEDLAGNVWEWTATPLGEDKRDQGPYWQTLSVDRTNERRVCRGGGWYGASVVRVRAADRDGFRPSHRNNGLGFRCARGVTP